MLFKGIPRPNKEKFQIMDLRSSHEKLFLNANNAMWLITY